MSIIVDCPKEDVFEFATDPANTSKWIDSIQSEEVSERPIRIGTKYRNQNHVGKWSTYSVCKLVPPEQFELISEDGQYHVRYSFQTAGLNKSIFEYFEWDSSGQLKNPFSQRDLEKFKFVIESESRPNKFPEEKA